eukprot:395314_1
MSRFAVSLLVYLLCLHNICEAAYSYAYVIAGHGGRFGHTNRRKWKHSNWPYPIYFYVDDGDKLGDNAADQLLTDLTAQGSSTHLAVIETIPANRVFKKKVYDYEFWWGREFAATTGIYRLRWRKTWNFKKAKYDKAFVDNVKMDDLSGYP